jgi:molybdate transport system substrate-binding protein
MKGTTVKLKLVGLGVVAASAALVLAGCSSTTSTPIATATESPAPTVSGSIVVDAASSLTGTFDTVAAAFEKLHPAATVTFNYGGSGDLAAAITAGAPVDVFAAASPATMTIVSTAKLTQGTPAVFVKNELEIVTPAGNPAGIKGLADFADASKKIALCETTEPCGAAAAAVFAAAKITPLPDTLEPNVKAALTAAELNQVDAGMVYHTDVLSGGTQVTGVTFPSSSQFIVSYPIAPLNTSKDPKLAAAFVAYVLTPPAQAILKHAGFITN